MKKASEYDWEEIKDALYAYASYLEETEPHAVNTIRLFRCAAGSQFTQ